MANKSFRMRTFLSVGFAIIILMTGLVILQAINGMGKMNDITSNIFSVEWKKAGLSSALIDLACKNNNMEKIIFHHTSEDELNNGLKTIQSDFEESDKLIAMLKSQIKSDEESKSLAVIEKNKEKYENSLNKVLALALKENKKSEARKIITEETAALFNEYKASVTAFTVLQTNHVTKSVEESYQTYRGSIRTLGVLGILTIFIGIACAYFLIRKIVNPINNAVRTMEMIAEGDFPEKIEKTSVDEAGRLNEAIRKVLNSLGGIAFAIKRISQGDLSVKLTPLGEKDILSKSVMDISAAMESLTNETNQLTKWAKEGKLNKRGNSENFKGVYKKLIEGINETLDCIIKPINEALRVLEAIASKDFTKKMKGNYNGDYAKIACALNKAIHNLSDNINRVSNASREITLESTQLSNAGQVIATGAMEQAESLEKVENTLMEITGITNKNTDHSDIAKKLSVFSRKSASKGKESMERLSEAIGQIKDSSDKTAKIVKTIDEIAFQTNLLALNAAVEAARAGDAGRGFAVVAEEVRNLAIRSAEAAKNTARMIDESVKKSDRGVELNEEVFANLEEINQNVIKTGDVVENIAKACSNQARLIDEVGAAVGEINIITQKNSANSEETASSCAELSCQAQEMQKMVEEFKIQESNKIDENAQTEESRPKVA